MEKKEKIKLIIIFSVVSVILLAVFFWLNNRPDDGIFEKKTVASDSQIKKLLSKNIDASYPGTPREVVKLYLNIIQCMYNSKWTESEFDGLIAMQRGLFDEEFLFANPLDRHKAVAKAEAAAAKENSRTILTYKVQSNNKTDRYKKNGDSLASLSSYYMMKEGTKYTYVYVEFVLREDENHRWKILGYRLADKTDIE